MKNTKESITKRYSNAKQINKLKKKPHILTFVNYSFTVHSMCCLDVL